MTLLIHDTVVVCDARTVLDNAAVAIEADRIVAVGPSQAVSARYPAAERIDGRGKAVLPGLINSHTHTLLIVLRATTEDWDGNAVYNTMVPVSFAMEPNERVALARLAALEAIRSGSTTLVDPFRFVVDYADGLIATGLRLVLSESCADIDTRRIRRDGYHRDDAFGAQFLDRTHALIERYHGAANGRVTVDIAAHATDLCSPDMLRRLLDLARQRGLRRTVHLAQSMDEVNQVRRAYARTPAEYLDDNGWLGPDLVGAHWTFCTDADVDLLAARGVHMAHCPANSSRKGPHTAPVDRIRAQGANICFGTDNMTEDMFHAMKIGLIVHRGRAGGSVSPPPEAFFDAVTSDAARSLGREHELGTVAIGKKADLTLIDLNSSSLRPLINLVPALVHYGHPGIVSSVMVDGGWVMRDGRVLTMNEDEVLAEGQAATERVWSRLTEQNPDMVLPRPLQWPGRQAAV